MMAEIIEEIVETSKDGRDGYLIRTTEQQIFMGISDGQCCCEQWGYLATDDDLESFVGAEVLGIQSSDKELLSIEGSLDEGGSMFIDVITSKGTFQFACYNSHNGYYAHGAVVESKQLSLEEYL